MNPYFLWLGILAIIFMVYFISRWRIAHKRSKFQARLFILFFLFVLVPTVLLLTIASALFTKSSRLLNPPEIEKALSQSLEILRLHFDEKGEFFLETHPDFRQLNPEILENNELDYAGLVNMQSGQAVIKHFISINPAITKPLSDITPTGYEAIKVHGFLAQNASFREQNFYEYYRLRPDSTIALAGFAITETQLQTRREISRVLKNYTSLSLFRETIIEKKLIWVIALILLIILALISFQLAGIISKGIGGPIKQLSDGMQHIGSGDLTYRLHIKADDEIAYLVESFNRMAEELLVSRERLKRAERAAAWRDVARQISHELKNPLTPIELSLYRLKTSMGETIANNIDLAESLRIIEEEIASMRRLASEFSEFARMPQLHLQDQDLAEIIKDSARLYSEHPVHLHIAPDIPMRQLDREQMRRVFNNLIKNAIEASAPQAPITISAEMQNQKIHIHISDSGCGMDEKELERVFDPYFTTKKDGTGLGLFIVQRIITDHGGELMIKSEKGRGTTIIIII